MKTYSICLLLILLCSCGGKQDINKQVYSKNQRINVVNEIDKNLKSPNKNDCDLTFLIRSFSTYASKLDKTHLDEERINFIKNQLIEAYKSYAEQEKSVLIISSGELKKRIHCYLDYLTNEKYKPVEFYEFWKNENYKSFRCNISAK